MVDANLGGRHGDPELLAFAQTVIGKELEHLRLVRLSGGLLEDETAFATHIQQILRRKL